MINFRFIALSPVFIMARPPDFIRRLTEYRQRLQQEFPDSDWIFAYPPNCRGRCGLSSYISTAFEKICRINVYFICNPPRLENVRRDPQ